MRTTFKKYLSENSNNFLTDRQEITNWLLHHNILNFDIQSNGVVNVSSGGVNLAKRGLINLPVKFGKVVGEFSCANNQLISFRGCPDQVYGGNFKGLDNPVTSYEFLPKKVGGVVGVGRDKVNTLRGIDWSQFSFEGFVFDANAIESGGIGLLHVRDMKWIYDINSDPTDPEWDEQWEIIAQYVGSPDDLFECQTALIDNGFEEFAQL